MDNFFINFIILVAASLVVTAARKYPPIQQNHNHHNNLNAIVIQDTANWEAILDDLFPNRPGIVVPTKSQEKVTPAQHRQTTTTQSQRQTTTQNRPVEPPPSSSSLNTSCGINRYMNPSSRLESSLPAQSARIVGGYDAKLNVAPWQVRLSGNNGVLCGATLITSRTILTAAHCYEAGVRYTAILGDQNLARTDPGERSIAVSKVIRHPNYSSQTNRNDFAIMILASEVSFSGWEIRPVCLPSLTNQPYAGKDGTITGWGKTAENSRVSDTLQLATVPIINNSVCQTQMSRVGVHIYEDQLCAARSSGGIDTCQGDSGGPITVLDNNKVTLVGVTSFGIGCGEVGRPGVYARVSSVIQWIQANAVGSIGYAPTRK